MTECVCCHQEKPEEAFHWQYNRRAVGMIKVRDQTCKCCRHESTRARRAKRRAARMREFNSAAADFLRLPRAMTVTTSPS